MAKKKATQKKESPPFTIEYYKAHRQLMFWSSILIAWELIGIDLEAMQTAGGNIGAVAKSIKSPQAVPWVILVLVGYFFYKYIIEWLQCDPHRRRRQVSRIDFLTSLWIAIIAFLIYLIRRLWNIRVAEVMAESSLVAAIMVFIFCAVVASFVVFLFMLRIDQKPSIFGIITLWAFKIIAIGTLILMIISSIFIFPDKTMTYLSLLGILTGIIIMVLPYNYWRREFHIKKW